MMERHREELLRRVDDEIQQNSMMADTLRQQIRDFMPGTVNNRRGAAVHTDDSFHTVDFTGFPEVPDESRHRVTFNLPQDDHPSYRTSTPGRPRYQPERYRQEQRDPQWEHQPNPQYYERYQDEMLRTQQFQQQWLRESADANRELARQTTKEFRKLKDTGISKFKGVLTGSAESYVYLKNWLEDIEECRRDRNMDDEEAIKLVKRCTADKARQQVGFYLDATLGEKDYYGLIHHLKTTFKVRETEDVVFSEFYNRRQQHKESVEEFADHLQILSRRILAVKPSWKTDLDAALKAQLINGLQDPYHRAMARSWDSEHRNFADFRAYLLSNIDGGYKSHEKKDHKQHKKEFNKHFFKKDKYKNAKSEAVEEEFSYSSSDEDTNVTSAASTAHKKDKFNKNTDDWQEMKKIIMQQNVSLMQQNKLLCKMFGESEPEKKGSKQSSSKSKDAEYVAGVDGKVDKEKYCVYCKSDGHDKWNCLALKKKNAKVFAVEQEESSEESSDSENEDQSQ